MKGPYSWNEVVSEASDKTINIVGYGSLIRPYILTVQSTSDCLLSASMGCVEGLSFAPVVSLMSTSLSQYDIRLAMQEARF